MEKRIYLFVACICVLPLEAMEALLQEASLQDASLQDASLQASRARKRTLAELFADEEEDRMEEESVSMGEKKVRLEEDSIFAAVRAGDIGMVEAILNDNPGIEIHQVIKAAQQWEKYDLLLRLLLRIPLPEVEELVQIAALLGDVAFFNTVLQVPGLNADSRGSEDANALIIAAKKQKPAIITAIVASGRLDLNARDCHRRTALMNSVIYDNKEVFNLLVDLPGVKLNFADSERKTALMHAAEMGRLSMVRKLLTKRGIKIAAKTKEGFNAFILADMGLLSSRSGNQQAIRTVLLAAGSRYDSVGFPAAAYEQLFPDNLAEGVRIHQAILNALMIGDIESLKQIFELGFTLNIVDQEGRAAEDIVTRSTEYADESDRLRVLALLKQLGLTSPDLLIA